MNRMTCNTVGQASSSSSEPLHSSNYKKDKSEVDQQKSESSLSDADSYQTADDDDQPSAWLVTGDDDAKQQQDGSEYESSSSSQDDDDSDTDEKVVENRSRLLGRRDDQENRRKTSYQFAVTEFGDLIRDTDDDDVVHDLDPIEFHHEHVQTSQKSDEDSDMFYDLDPREFSHPSTQATQMTRINMTINSNVVVKYTSGSTEDGKSGSDEQKRCNSEVFEDDPHAGPLDALSLLYRGHSEVSSTERHESTVEGSVLPTIVILSPTEKTLVTDHREHIVRRCTKRAVFIPEHLRPFIAVGKGQLTNHVLTSVLHQCPPESEQLVSARLSSAEKDKEPLPVIKAVVSEETELIHANVISTADLWKQYDDTNFSSSPEKDSRYPFEEGIPSPDYGSSTSSSDTGSEADADVAVDTDVALNDDIRSETPPPRTERSPTPDYMLSPERGMEFGKLADGESDEIEEVDGVKEEFRYDPRQLLFARTGSQRFPKPVHPPAVTLEPALPEQADENRNTEYDQNSADISNAVELTQSVASPYSRDSYRAREQCRAGIESAPVTFSPNEQGMFDQSHLNTRTSSADKSTIYNTLGQNKKRRTAKRSVVISCCIMKFTGCYSVSVITVRAVVLTCYISHSTKYIGKGRF